MMHLVQGEGIIDIVNAYLGIALSGGLLGLAAFLMPLLIALHRRLAALRKAAIPEGRDADLALVALTLVALVVLVTTSSFSVIPLLLMLLVALPPASGEVDPRRRRPGALR
jgi:O-antigen ligase